MRAIFSATLSKRLDKVAGAVQADRIRIPGGVIHYGNEERLFAALAECPQPKRGGYLLVPPILPIDEWEQAALDSQVQLVVDTSSWLGPPAVVNAPDPAIVTDRYRVAR
jgi:hypothetical protein